MPDYLYPPLGNHQTFESFCRDFFEVRWDAPITIYGRSGQSQHGVDLLAPRTSNDAWWAVQCKQTTKDRLAESVMADELGKTAGLKAPYAPLGRYVFATTAPRDKATQDAAQALATEFDFDVEVFAWDDFCDALADARYAEVASKYFPHMHREAAPGGGAPPAEALDVFRTRHFARLLPLPSLALAAGHSADELLLTDIYTALDVEATIRVVRSKSSRSGPGDHAGGTTLPGDSAYLDALVAHEQALLDADKRKHTMHRQRRCRVVEAVAANRHLVLVGAPGSGKSTFGRFLVACLLGEHLQRRAANRSKLVDADAEFDVWPHGAPLALFVSLQAFQASPEFPRKDDAAEAGDLIAYLSTLGRDDMRSALSRGIEAALNRRNGALIVLDGLDETPSAEASRLRLHGVICDFVRAYPECRVLVTSRPYAYQADSSWRLDSSGFASVELAPFDAGQQQTFVESWYRRLAARQLSDVTPERRDEMAGHLIEQVREVDYLSPLATNPLMLTMMADVHASHGGRLPTGGRAALYAESVSLLLDRWNERQGGYKPSTDLGMPVEQIQEALQSLAFEVHRSRGVSDEVTPEIQRAELWEALARTREVYGHEGTVDDTKIMAYLHQRSGILQGESETIYRFPHRSYQEYLAALHLIGTDFPNLLDEVVTEDPALWREVVPLAVGEVPEYMAWTIVETLVPEDVPADALDLDDPRFLRAVLAGLSIRECHLAAKKLGSANAAKLERIRRWSRRAVEVGALDVQDRVQAGQVLGLLGDDRPGVGLVDGLPRFEWVEIPAGSFVMGGERNDREKPVHDEAVGPYRISRYPLTNAQYQPFVKVGGYTEACRRFWTEAGWSWKESEQREGPVDGSHPFNLPNHPRVGVSWYEAIAYCRWLSDVTGVVHRIPTEAEWERAARGTDGREYPWGERFDSELCNAWETGMRTATTVGLFPAGEGPPDDNGIGLLDASGNVLEWCSSKLTQSYDEPADDDLEGSAVRVLRGGSFANNGISARCACRNWDRPVDLDWGVGYRVVSPLNP